MENYLIQITSYLLTQSWQIAVLVVVIAAVSLALRNRSSHVRYLLWLIVLAKCLMPPLLTVPLAVLPEEKSAEPVPISHAKIPAAVAAVGRYVAESPARASAPAAMPRAATVPETRIRLTARQWLGLGWFVGVGAFLFFAAVKALRTNRWLRRERKPLPAELQSGIEDFFPGLGLRIFPKVWLVEGIGQPFVWGLLRGSIYLPADFVKVNSAEHRKDVLGHELSHILQFDAAVNLLQIIAQAVFWFHPFVWWANKRIRAEREKRCDEMAIARLSAKARDYSSAIVNTLINEYESTRPVPSLAVAGPVKNIEERIKTIMRPGKKFYRHPSLVAATIVLLLAVLTVPTTFVLAARAQEKPPAEQEAISKSLCQAAKDGDLEQVKKLIAAGADVNAGDERGQTPLHFAARGGYDQIARLLIAQGADVNVSMERGPWTPLLDAALAGHAKVVKVLLENGAEVDATDSWYTPLYYAIWSDDEETVRALISGGTDVNVCPKGDYHPLFYAVWQWHAGIVKAIIDAGANVNAQYENEDGWTPLHYAVVDTDADVAKLFVGTGVKIPAFHSAVLEGDLAKVRQLVESGTDVDTKDELGWTPSFWALSTGQKEVFAYLVGQGADIAAKTNGGRTLLHQASRAGSTEIVKQLIAKGADVGVKSKNGETPLQCAASGGHEEAVKLLLAKGADVNTTSNRGRHPLGDAAQRGHEDVVKLLIASGANVNLHAQGRGSALHAAAQRGRSTILDLLIANGADVNLNARAGTPLHLAARGRAQVDDEKCAEMVEKLLAKGADVNAKNPQAGRTPLHIAARRGRRKAAELLVAAGADVNAKGAMGHTPLWCAKEEGNTEIIELLRKHGAIESLHDAAGEGDISQVKRLISQGADVNAKSDGFLLTPMHLAAIDGHKEVCELLIAKGAEVNAKSGEVPVPRMNYRDEGLTPLHAACLRGHQEVAKLLLDHGAEVNAKTKHSRTPLDLARMNDHKQVVELLQKHGAKEGISLQDRFENAKLISPGTWLEGSFQYRDDEAWFAIDVEKNKSYLISYDDEFGTGEYSADIETYFYKNIVDDLESKHCLFTDRHDVYQQPIKFTSDYKGKLYLRLISDNPQDTTFAIKYEIEK